MKIFQIVAGFVHVSAVALHGTKVAPAGCHFVPRRESSKDAVVPAAVIKEYEKIFYIKENSDDGASKNKSSANESSEHALSQDVSWKAHRKHRKHSQPNVYSQLSGDFGIEFQDLLDGDVKEHFPIHAIKISALLKYDKLPSYQQATSDGTLEELSPDCPTPIVFVSHQYSCIFENFKF